jgi:competence protein ComEA
MAQSRFRRGGADQAAQAQRRLEFLRRDLEQAGVRPSSTEPPPTDPTPTLPDELAVALPVVVPDPGRHARRRGPGVAARLAGWLVDRLPPPLQGRVALGESHAVLVALVAAAALAVAAVLVLRSGSGGAATVALHRTAGPASASPLAVPASAGDASGATTGAVPVTPPSSPAVVVVDVAGKVRHPGVTTLPAGSRVVDAIRRAGGARRGVDLSGLNLARVLVDGEQILVGTSPAPGVAASAASTATAGTAGPLVNINTATLEGLETLPGVGPVTAQKILDWRTAHGAFTSVDELLEVDGIGEKTLAQLAPHVTL